jgi:dTDP-4-dehydrorhamnose reductase
MLGTELCRLLETVGLEFFGTDRVCDITESAILWKVGKSKKVAWIVNCAAYTGVDKSEDEEALARRINAEGVGNIAACARELGAALIHISTDFVFAGDGDRPYLEEDPIRPIGAYGRTKAEGEALVRREFSRHFILRTAWLYGRYGNNFVYTMLRLMREREQIGVVEDQRGNPTWSRDLAAAIVKIIDSSSELFGTFHFTNEGETTWYHFAKEIYRLGRSNGLLKHEVEIVPLSTEGYPTKARRPAYSVLSKSKIREVLGCTTPDWKISLELFMYGLAEQSIPAGYVGDCIK